MLNLFRRRNVRGGSAPEGPGGPILASHILVKFLKRLRAMERANLLDLGRLSGANIEFFARVGCRVQVEDLLGSGEGTAGDRAMSEAASAQAASGHGEGSEAPPDTGATDAAQASGAHRVAVPSVSEIAPLARRPGARPSRRVVLPPRVFHGGGARPGAGGGPAGPRLAGAGSSRPGGRPCALPTSFPFPDESFDAVVAWDIYNYYDPDAARIVAAETRRILRPGGLVLAYFHARRLDGLESPGRYRILDDTRVACDPLSGQKLRRHVYQNRDIEKMFTGLRIAELYFLKTSMREILMEKKSPVPEPLRARRPEPEAPKPRFTIE